MPAELPVVGAAVGEEDGDSVPVGEVVGDGLPGDALGDWLPLWLGEPVGLTLGEAPCGPCPGVQVGDGECPP